MIRQLSKFSVTGAINFFIDLTILNILIFLFRDFGNKDIFIIFGLTFGTFSLFKSIAFIIANINSFFMNKYWTFDSYGKNRVELEYVKFFSVSLVGLAINVLSFSLALDVLDIYFGDIAAATMSAVIGSFFGLIWNFAGYKFIVFKGYGK